MLLDVRTYRCRPGTIKSHLQLYSEIGKPAQSKHLGNPLLFATTETGNPNEYTHIWVYKNEGNPVHYFRGLKGQYIIVVPHQNRVIVRIGEKRGPHYKVPSSRIKDRSFRAKNDPKLGHTIDLFEYLQIADRIVAERKQK